ncbi:MAG: InlB B-repeat-containing protein [Oscillospiraceae bacterium]|nr:InlB B-repeat-containing protein [Oscillospiraceae bacterium]
MKKFLCLLAAFLMAMPALQQKAAALEIEMKGEIFGFYEPASYAWMSVPTEKDSGDISEKLAKLRELSGSYFTVNGEPCKPAPGDWVHGCSNCETTYLITTNIFDLMPQDRNCLPSYYLYNGTMSNICQSCAAFASMAHWYLYAGESTDAVRVNKIASGLFDEATLANAKPGDIIALSSVSTGRHYHSMIFIEHVPGGIRVIDNNWGTQTYGNCYVMERTSSYSSKYYAVISRASNYAEEQIAVTGVEIVDPESGEPLESIEMEAGTEKQLSAEIQPSDATDKTVVWSSSDTSVAEVSPEGVVTAVGAGKAEITAAAGEGAFSDFCAVEVKEKFYTVSYNANGGENAPESQIKTGGKELLLSSEIPSREGHSFMGWASFAESAEAEYQPGDIYSADADITLYAVWQKNTYTVLYNANGGTAAPEKQTKFYGEPLVLSAVYPFRNGYTFLGWASSAEAKAPEYQPGGVYDLNENIVLYAVWEEKKEEILLGDVDGNGKINVLDANLVRRYAAKFIDFDEKQLSAADVDGNGSVNVLDANLIRRYAAKIIEAFPAEG